LAFGHSEARMRAVFTMDEITRLGGACEEDDNA